MSTIGQQRDRHGLAVQHGHNIDQRDEEDPVVQVGAYDKEEGVIIVVTAYEPDTDRWEDHSTRRTS